VPSRRRRLRRKIGNVHARPQTFELLGPSGQPPLYYIRTLQAHANDERWTWHENGTPQPFEDTSSAGCCWSDSHSVEVLLRVYVKCIEGQDETAKRRI